MKKIWLLSILFAAALSQSAKASVISTFTANDEGWNTVRITDAIPSQPNFAAPLGSNALTHSASGGNPGGRVSIVDPTGDWQYFSAPAAFLGNQSASLGLNLTFDLIRLDSFTIAPISSQGPLVAVTDGTTILVYSSAFTLPQTSGWLSYTVPLSAGNWKLSTKSGALATSSQLNTVFSNLTRLYINADMFAGAAEAGQGVPETIGLDNVNLPSSSNAVPEPGTIAFVGIGISALLWHNRRR